MTNPIPLLPLPQLLHLADLSRASGSWLATIGVGLAVTLPVGAAADPLEVEARPRPIWTRWLDPNAERPPIGENVYYKKGAGLEYRQEAKFGESPVVMGVQGPLLKTKKDPSPFADPNARQKRLSGVGVTFELRF